MIRRNRKSEMVVGRMLKCLLLAMLICKGSFVLCQPTKFDQKFVDSTTPLLSSMPNDTNTVNILLKLASMHVFVNPALTLHYADWGDSIANIIGYQVGRINCLAQSAFHYAFAGEWAKAEMKIDEAIPLCEKYKPEKMIYMYNLMYIVESTKGESVMAMHYAHMPFYSSAFQKVSSEEKWPTYYQLGRTFEEMNKLDSAQYCVDMLNAIAKEKGYPDDEMARNTIGLAGLINVKRKEYQQAINNFKRAGYYSELAEVYQLSNQSDSAILYGEKALVLGRVSGNRSLTLSAAKVLSDAYANLDLAKANYYLKLYLNTRDSIYNSQKFRQIEQINLEKQRREYELNKKIAESRNRSYYLLLFVILLSLAILTFFLFKNNRFKQRSNLKLEAALSELKATQAQLVQSEKMASLGELTAGIAHEIQNPLNFVNNFSDLNSELVSEMKEEIVRGNLDQVKLIAESIDENEKKISEHGKRADAIVKGMLQHSRTGNGQTELTDLNALCEEWLRLAYHGMRAKDKLFNASMKTDFEQSVGLVKLIPQDMGRVLLNVFNNAFYAVVERAKESQNGYEPTVSVSTRKTQDGIRIAVVDNGKGIPEKIRDKIFQPFFTTKPTGQGTGLGLSLSYDIMKAQGGSLSIGQLSVNKEGNGTGLTEFIIVVPVKSI